MGPLAPRWLRPAVPGRKRRARQSQQQVSLLGRLGRSGPFVLREMAPPAPERFETTPAATFGRVHRSVDRALVVRLRPLAREKHRAVR
jgi:hypothetical protein